MLASKIKIRRAKIEDAAQIAVVHVDTWRSAYKGILPETLLASLDYESRAKLWEKNIVRSNNHVWIAEDENAHIIAFADTSKKEKNSDRSSYDLTSIYVLPEYHRRGIGTNLLLKLFEFYEQQQIEMVFIPVLTENPAKFFYKKLGAKRTKTVSIVVHNELISETTYKFESVKNVIHQLKEIV